MSKVSHASDFRSCPGADIGICWDIRGGNVAANIRQRAQVIAFPCHNRVNQQFVLDD